MPSFWPRYSVIKNISSKVLIKNLKEREGGRVYFQL